MQMKRIENLLHKYLEGIESDAEHNELMSLIDSGIADEVIKHKFEEELAARIESDVPSTGREEEELNEVYERIKSNIASPQKEPGVSIKSPSLYSIRRIKKGKHLRRIAAVAAMLLLAILGSWYIGTKQAATYITDDIRSFSFTGPQQITLPDSSIVLLNDGSSIIYQNIFGKEYREVWLTGEAFFEVEHDPSTFFVVRTGEIKTTVLGTSFNIKAAEEDEEVTVSVNSGIVEVGDEEQIFERILADEQLAVNKLTREFEKIHQISKSSFSWKNRFIILNDIKLEEAVEKIGERFNVTISISNESLSQLTVSATFLEEEGLEHIMRSICVITQSSYTIDGNHIQIEGGIEMD